VCPVKIDIPKILLQLRAEVQKANLREGKGKLERIAFRAFAWVMCHPRIYELAGLVAAAIAPPNDGAWIRQAPAMLSLPPMRAWLSQRDLPPPPAKSFRQMWRER
jgi:L-lactate dehydrogenase complex protein LldF